MTNKGIAIKKPRTGRLWRISKSPPVLWAVTAALVISACGPSGGGSTPPPSSDPSATVVISGSLSALAKAKSSIDAPAVNRAVAAVAWADATLQVVDASGAVIGAGTVNADGTYSVSVVSGSNYIIRAQSGNLVLKAFVSSVSANTSVNVTSTSTVEVMVLAQVLGVANLGDAGVDAAVSYSSVNVAAVVIQIAANPNIAALATVLSANIAAGYDATSTTASIGAVDVTVAASVTAISSTVSTTAVPAVPSSPAGIGVAVGDRQVVITWTAVTGATSYNLYYRTAANVTIANGTKVPNVTSGGAITGLTNGTTYYFVVTAVNAGGESAVSSEVGATPQVSAPGAPTGVGVTAGDARATVSWTAVTGATSYNLYYRTAANVTIANGTKVPNVTSGGAITGFTNGITYYFVITAVNAGGESAVSSEVGATPQVSAPGAPTGVGVTAGDARATVSWVAVTGATSYNIYYDTAGGVATTGDKVLKVTGAASGGAITGLVNGTRYYFVVTAVNAGGESAVSSEVNAMPQLPVPAAPTGVGATAGNGQIFLGWTAPAGTVTSYNVYYKTGAPGVTIGGVGVTKKAGVTSGGAITALTNGTAYYFVVTALNAGVESVISGEVSTTPQASTPLAPTNLGAVAGTGNVTVSWTAPAGTVTSYNVYYGTAAGVTVASPTKSTGITATSVTITPLVNATIYYFVVTAVNASGESARSFEVSATPQAVVAPTGVSVTGGDNSAMLSWVAASGATSYNIYRSTTSGVLGALIGSATQTVYTDATAVNGVTYFYTVTAVQPGGESSAGAAEGLADGAENGMGLWVADSPWGITTNASNAGTYSFTDSPAGNYANNVNASLTLATPLNFTSAVNPALSFSHKYATEASWDFCYVEASGNGGATWTQLAAYSGALAVWTPVSINLNAYTGQASVKIRFRFTSDKSVASDGWYLDDIAVTGNATQVSAIPLMLPASPILSATTMPGDGRVTINWTDPAGGGAVTSHTIYYIAGSTVSTGTPGAVKIPALGGAATSYTVSGLTNGMQYSFIVTAVNSTGETASASLVTATPSGVWTTKTPMLYQRDNAANAVLNGIVYVMGGAPAGIGILDSMEAYNPVTDTWATKAPLPAWSAIASIPAWGGVSAPPAYRYGPAAAAVNGVVYLIGGTSMVNGQGPIYPIAAYNPTTNTWSSTVPSTAATIAAGTSGHPLAPFPTGRWGFDVAVVDGLIYAIGGAIQSALGVNTFYGTVEMYDPVANSWTTKAPMPTPRWGSTVSVVNGLIYAIGGWGGWPELSLAEIYDPVANAWSVTVPANAATVAAGTAGAALAPMPTARDDFGFAVVDGLIYAIGGDINTFNDLTSTPCCTQAAEAYDPVANAWSVKTNMPTMRDDFDASTVDGVIYAIAGSRDGIFTVNPTAPNGGGFSLTLVEAYSSSSIAVPKAVTATAGANQVSLSWNAVAGATAYNIYWSNKAGVSTTANSAKIANVTSPHIHTGLTAGTWYYYVVTAVTASGESLPCNEVAVKP